MSPTIIVIAILALIAIYIIGIYSSLISLKIRVKEAWNQIDEQLKRRADIIPALVEMVKAYAKNEEQVFENVTKARTALMNAKDPKETGVAEVALTGALKSLFAIAEVYPALKAQEGFVNLQKELSDTEDKVSYSRQFFNSVVRDFNEKITVFPLNIFAGIFGFTAHEIFEANNAEKEVAKVTS